MPHAAQPEQTQQYQLVEKEVGYHRVAPFHGGEMGALYPFCRLLNYPHDRGTRPAIWGDKKHHFEVIVGKSMRSFGEGAEDRPPSLKRFGFVQTLDTQPKRRLYEVLHSWLADKTYPT